MKQIDATKFGDLTPVKTYDYYDGPLSFSTSNENKWFYVHWMNCGDEFNSYFLRETTEEELKLLENKQISLSQFLKEATPLYLIEYSKNIKAFEINPDDFLNSFPDEDCYL